MKNKMCILERIINRVIFSVRFIMVICIITLAFLSTVIYNLAQWILDTWGLLSIDEIIFHLKVPLDGTNEDMIYDAIYTCVPTALMILLLSIVLLIAVKNKKLTKIVVLCSCMIFSFLLIKSAYQTIYNGLDIKEYLEAQSTHSSFIRDNYVDPRAIQIIFPEQKRNLVYIFLESMENTYASIEAGGAFPDNYIPELTTIAENNTSFSNTELLGGGYAATGATWTMGAMFAQTTGMPLKVNDQTLMNKTVDDGTVLFPQVYTIGELLEEQGYQQVLMIGSDGKFAGRSSYFEEHGNYEIFDYNKVMNEGLLPEGYHEWWGFEDQKLFEFAKQKMTEMSLTGQPFNLTMLTADTHFEDGYECPLCQNQFADQYANVLACSSRQIEAFIEWIQQQPFYANTSIVLVGDHLTMDWFCNEVGNEYDRTIYNAFINPAVQTEYKKNREFTTMDMYPTTLASLGVSIEGDRLGLGTNLFSGVETLTEIFGIDKENKFIEQKSEFYDNLMKKD